MQTADPGPLARLRAERGHTVAPPPPPLVSDDPTLLFTVAGMVPFVPYLTGLFRAVPACHERVEVHPHPPTSRRSARPRVTAPSSR
jgi:hypothetical protein